MERPIRIAIVGCGWAGRQHARGCRAGGAAIRWAIDTQPERAATLAAEHPGARASSDYRDALADADLDAVDLCLPHNLHAPLGIEAALAGKHVLVEKPLAANLEEADALIAAAEQAHVVLAVGENVRYEPLFRRIRALLEEGAIGRPALVQRVRECYLRESFLRDRPWFLDARAAAGGIMTSGGIHDFELLRMLLGEIASVYALRAPQRFEEMQGDDTSVALIQFAGGAVGTLVESFLMKSLATAEGPEVHRLRIDGELGSLWCDDGAHIHLFSEAPAYRPTGELREQVLYVPPADTFQLLLQDFLRAVRTGAEPLTSGRSQRPALAAVMAAYASMRTGLPVPLGL